MCSSDLVATVVLLGAGGIAHGPSFAVVMTALGLTALVLAPASWRSWRRGEARLRSTPSVRIAGLVAGSGLLTAAGIFGVLRASPDTPKLARGELVKKLRQDLPLYRFWLTAPLAAAGAAVLARAGLARPWPAPDGGEVATGRLTARVLLTILLSWTAVSLAGVVLFEMGRNSPAHRFLSFLLPLPLLVAVAVLAGGRWVARRRRALGAAAVALAVLGLGVLGWWTLFVDLAGPGRGVEWIDKGKVQDALAAAAYLDAAKVPLTAPVVFVIDDGGPNPLSYVPEMTYILRSVLAADRIPHAFFYVGNPDRYLAGEPTLRDRPSTYDANEARFWPTIQRILPLRPVALVLSSYNPLYGVEATRHPDWLVAPGVLAPNGPRPGAPVAQPPIPTGPTTVPQGAVLGAGTLVALTLIGVGWAAAEADIQLAAGAAQIPVQ